jgi:ActR/RegA family two-component response regulator
MEIGASAVSHPRILVISPGTRIGEILAGAPSDFEVIAIRPGPDVVEVARREQPQIAVIDGIHERAEVALLEIALLKDLQPDVQIIVLSERSSVRDARIVEQGIFYYMTAPPGQELIRVIDAATRLLARKKGAIRGPIHRPSRTNQN